MFYFTWQTRLSTNKEYSADTAAIVMIDFDMVEVVRKARTPPADTNIHIF